jgi:hypothetical protein
VVKAFNGTTLADWQNTNAKLPAKPILDWNNADFEDTLRPFEARFANIDSSSWMRVRQFVIDRMRDTR